MVLHAPASSVQSVLDPEVFCSPTIFQQEQDSLFSKVWQFVGLRSELDQPHHFAALSVGQVPVVVQNSKGQLQAFHNVCTHRQALLQTERFGSRPLLCPYHGWFFNGEGQVTIPKNADHYAMDACQQEALCLPTYRVETCGNLVFVCLDAKAPSLQQQLGEWFAKLEQWSANFSPLYAYTEIRARCNWKLLVYNLFDTTHAPYVHKTTIRPEDYDTPEWLYYPFDPATHDAAFPRLYNKRHLQLNVFLKEAAQQQNLQRFVNLYPLQRFPLDAYLHCFLYPNHVVISTQGLWYFISRYQPVSPTETIIENFCIPMRQPEAGVREPLTPDYLHFLMQSSVRVYQEDIAVCETIQNSFSRASRPGYFGKVEQPMAHFEQAYQSWRQEYAPA